MCKCCNKYLYFPPGDFNFTLLQAKLRSNEFAILRLTIRTSRSEAQQWGEINIQTQYEHLSIPVHFKVAQGKLEIGPDRLVFDQCFPVSSRKRKFDRT